MPDLLQTLMDQDFGFIRIIAELWHIEPPQIDSLSERSLLAHRMLESDEFNRVLSELPESANRVLADLQQNEGRMLWNTFARKYGDVREFGPGKRDREQPYLDPSNPAEILWYRGFVARAFLKKSSSPQEFAYIPSDIQELLPTPAATSVVGSSMKINPHAADYLATVTGEDIIDHSCTMLAALRLDISPNNSPHLPIQKDQVDFLNIILRSANLLEENGDISPEMTKEFLEASRSAAWQTLFRSWTTSSSIRELFDIPEITIEKADGYSPLTTRSQILSEISTLHPGEWIELENFVDRVMDEKAEFLRPDANFDTWLIRSVDNGEYLSGFEHWNDVEGRFIYHLICGPLFWLGAVELGYPSHGRIPAAFRVTPAGHLMLLGASPEAWEETGRILLKPGSQLICPPLLPRWVRYLLARMSDWTELTKDGYSYQITPKSLAAAQKQSLRVHHLISLIRKYGATLPSPSLVRSFQRWEDHGNEIMFENIQVLRVVTPEILNEIMKSKASRYLAEPLGPTAVVIKPGSGQKLSRVLIELGYLSEVKFEL